MDNLDKSLAEVKSELEARMLSSSELLDIAAHLTVNAKIHEAEKQRLEDQLKVINEQFTEASQILGEMMPEIRKCIKAYYTTLTPSMRAMVNAYKKLESDPKQKEKVFVCECWQDWQKNPDRYKSKAAFARDMLTKCEHLISQKKIEDWCREWENSVPSQHNEH